MRLTAPLFSVFGHAFSGRDLILSIGGLFLIYKATHEIHDRLEGEEGHVSARVAPTFAAVLIAVVIMMFSAGTVSGFVERHPSVKVLALSFLLLIGFSLIADGFGVHIPKGYIYFAMGFSVFVEVINLRAHARSKTKPVKLHDGYSPPGG